jgi:diguanylate cyclase (GGDEF)-like protein
MALPIAALVACALVLAAAAATWWTAREQNRFAAATQARLAAGALTVVRGAMESKIVDYAQWDEAAQHVAIERDLGWVYDNIAGDWLAESDGLEMAFLLDGQGRAFYGIVEGERTDRPPADLLTGGLDRVVAAARAGVGPASGLVRTEAVPAVVVAHRIQPHTGKVALPPGADVVLVLIDLLDARRLGELGALYLLPDLHVLPGEAATGVPLTAADGTALGALGYAPKRPGDDLLRRVAPPLAALGFGLALVAVLALRQACRAASELRASEARALTDGLTGLPNRALLRERLGTELARLRPGGPGVGLLYLDLDGFKRVNDTHGHAAGDELLVQVARRLEGCARAAGDTVARFGGDEFVILLPATVSAEAVAACAERVVAALREPFRLGAAPEGVAVVGVSVGVAHAAAGTADLDADELLRAADRALYRAKREGRGTWRLAEELPAEPPGGAAPRQAAPAMA